MNGSRALNIGSFMIAAAALAVSVVALQKLRAADEAAGAVEERLSKSESIYSKMSYDIGTIRADLGENHLLDGLSTRVIKLEGAQEEMLERERSVVLEAASMAIVELTEKYAGTSNEAFGKERALYHAKKLEAVGALGPFKAAQDYVDTSFKVMRERKGIK